MKGRLEIRNEREAYAAIKEGLPPDEALIRLAKAAGAAECKLMPDGTIAYAGNTLDPIVWGPHD